MRKDTTAHVYIRNLVTTAKIISPDDENVKLTETMKKECEGKTIFYNSQHYVEEGDEQEGRKTKIIGTQNEKQKNLKNLLPKNTTATKGQRGLCTDVKVKIIF